MTRDASSSLLPDLIAADLAMTVEETREILGILADQKFVDWKGASGVALVTPDGENYLLRVAGRRRSVRFKRIGFPGFASRSGMEQEDVTANKLFIDLQRQARIPHSTSDSPDRREPIRTAGREASDADGEVGPQGSAMADDHSRHNPSRRRSDRIR